MLHHVEGGVDGAGGAVVCGYLDAAGRGGGYISAICGVQQSSGAL